MLVVLLIIMGGTSSEVDYGMYMLCYASYDGESEETAKRLHRGIAPLPQNYQ